MLKGTLILAFSPWEKGLLSKERRSPVRRESNGGLESAAPCKAPRFRGAKSRPREPRRKGTLILTFSHRKKGLLFKERRSPVRRESDGGLESAAPCKASRFCGAKPRPREPMRKGTRILTFSHREKGLLLKERRSPVRRRSDGGLESAAPWELSLRRGNDSRLENTAAWKKLPLPEGEGWGEGQSGWRSRSRTRQSTFSAA